MSWRTCLNCANWLLWEKCKDCNRGECWTPEKSGMIVEQQTWRGIMKIEVLSATEAIVDGERMRVCQATKTADPQLTILEILAMRERGHLVCHAPDHCDGYGIEKVREPPPPEHIGEWLVSGPNDGNITVRTSICTLNFSRDTVKKMLARFDAVWGG